MSTDPKSLDPLAGPEEASALAVAEQRSEKVSLLEVRETKGDGTVGDLLIRLDFKGGVEFGADYTPEAAARVFWESLANRSGLSAIEDVCAAHGYRLVKADV